METFKERLIVEKEQLDEKLIKLKNFIIGPAFVDIESVQRSLLIIQMHAMETYSHCLDERIMWLEGK
jgi:hypothetical protein